eukprot:GILJ01013887.1.p1 GENE.GILJ01013887.1~~GILJ01013887.1.p1  ORF type:complete len:778 (-),score=125.49 GILJ01013887.1:93-2393(-)
MSTKATTSTKQHHQPHKKPGKQEQQVDNAASLAVALTTIRESHVERLKDYLQSGVFQRSNQQFMQIYGMVVELADKDDMGKDLFNFYKDTITDYVCNVVAPCCVKLYGEELLKEAAKRWENHKIFVYWMQRVFQYLDRYYCPNNNLPPLFQLGLNILLTGFFENIKNELQSAFLSVIQRDREDETTDRGLMRTICNMFVQVGMTDVKITKGKDATGQADVLLWSGGANKHIYTTNFEAPFLKASHDYWEAQAVLWLETMSCLEYVRKVHQVIESENERVRQFLDDSTTPKLMSILDDVLILAHASQLLEMDSGILFMIKNEQTNNLALLYQFLKRVPATLDIAAAIVQPYLCERGDTIVKNTELIKTPIPYVAELLKFKQQVDDMVKGPFENHAIFQKARNKAFEVFMNYDSKNAQMLAVYCDFQLKKDLKGKSEAETEATLDNIVKLFCHLHDRDIFVTYYKIHLSRRLLQHSSVSDEAEHLMIEKLKVECGYHLTSKLAGMFTDIRLSKEINTDFKALSHKARVHGIDTDVQVLTAGFWPEMKILSCRMSDDLTRVAKTFTSFYQDKHSGRKLTFMLHLGSAEVASHCYKQPYTLIVSTYQAIILQLFNIQPTWTCRDIGKETEIPEAELKRHLISMFAPKQRVLLKSTKTAECNLDDEFSINPAFESRTRRVPITLIKAAEEDATIAAPQANDERAHVVEAAIVRIMKSRKTLTHNELIQTVIEQMNMFKPQPMFIKSRIESLIEREYLERDKTERNKYIYMP